MVTSFSSFDICPARRARHRVFLFPFNRFRLVFIVRDQLRENSGAVSEFQFLDLPGLSEVPGAEVPFDGVLEVPDRAVAGSVPRALALNESESLAMS